MDGLLGDKKVPLADTWRATEVKTSADGSDLLQLQEWLKQTENSQPEMNWRSVGLEDYRFYAGDQDTDEVKAALSSLNRPASVFNEVKPKIDMLIGVAAQSKQESSVIPVSGADEAIAEIMNHAIKHFRRQLKLTRKELECFEHTVKCGRSLLYFYVDQGDNPFRPKICARRIPGWQFKLDPYSTEYDMSDARFLFIDKWVTEEDLKTWYPGVDVGWLQQSKEADDPLYYNEANDLYRLVECWYYKYVKGVWFINPMTGKEEFLTRKEFAQFNRAVQEGIPMPNGSVFRLPQAIQGVERPVRKMHYSIFSNDIEIEAKASPYRWKEFPAILFGAYRNEDDNSWFGAVTMMKDPQRALNTMRRQLSHLLQTLPKGILAHEVGAILNIEEYEERSSEPNFHLEVGQGKIDKFNFIQQPVISPIYEQLDQLYSQSMKNASGIQNEMMGVQTTSREPGVTVRMRQQTGFAVIYSLFDNFMESRDQATRVLMNFIQQYVSEDTLIRIEGEEGSQLLRINSQLNPQVQGFNDITVGEYDLVAHSTAENATMRLAIAQTLVEFGQNNPGMVPPDLILEYMDVPFTVKQRIREHFMQQQQAAAQAQEREFKIREMEVMLKKEKVDKDNMTKLAVAKQNKQNGGSNGKSGKQRSSTGSK